MVITTINIKEKGCDNQGQKLGCLEDSWSQTNKTLILNIFPIPQWKADTLFLLLLLLLFFILFFSVLRRNSIWGRKSVCIWHFCELKVLYMIWAWRYYINTEFVFIALGDITLMPRIFAYLFYKPQKINEVI